VTPGNVGNSQGYGGEIEIKGSHPSGYRWDASYSFSRVADEGDVKSSLDYEGSAPMHHVRLLLGYTTGPWEVDGFAQLVTATNMLRGNSDDTAYPTYTNGYETVSGRIGYKISDNLTFAVSGTNLNAHTLQVSPYPAVERQIFATLTGKF
jgi:iron complex outermembrane receptor protein